MQWFYNEMESIWRLKRVCLIEVFMLYLEIETLEGGRWEVEERREGWGEENEALGGGVDTELGFR